MKRFLSILFALVMTICVGSSQLAFAAEVGHSTESATMANENYEIQPYGSLNGYGGVWYEAGNNTTGTFTVEVTGSSWLYASTTFTIENFNSKTCVRTRLYNPNGVCVYDTYAVNGADLTMDNPSLWGTFYTGMTGTYTVKYEIFTTDGSNPSSGRIMCWIY